MAILRRGGPEREDLVGHRVAVGVLGRLQERDGWIRAERLHDALRDEDEREDDESGSEDVERAAREVDPEVAEGRGRLAGDAANERDHHRHARRRADEVLHGEREHLREVAHRRLAAVALPVRVRGEADGGVPREVRRDGAANPCGLSGKDPCSRWSA